MRTQFTVENEEEPNKYQQYLRRKQSPVPLAQPSTRIANRISQIQQRQYPKSQHQQLSLSSIQLKARIQQLQRQLSSQRNTILIKQQKIKQLNQQLLNQPRRYKQQIELLKLTLQKKQNNHNGLEQKCRQLLSKNNQLQKIIENYTKQLQSFTL